MGNGVIGSGGRGVLRAIAYGKRCPRSSTPCRLWFHGCSMWSGGSLLIAFGPVAPHSRQTTATVAMSSSVAVACVGSLLPQKGQGRKSAVMLEEQRRQPALPGPGRSGRCARRSACKVVRASPAAAVETTTAGVSAACASRRGLGGVASAQRQSRPACDCGCGWPGLVAGAGSDVGRIGLL